MVQESDELVKVLGKTVHNVLRNAAAEGRQCNCALIEHCAFGIEH